MSIYKPFATTLHGRLLGCLGANTDLMSRFSNLSEVSVGMVEQQGLNVATARTKSPRPLINSGTEKDVPRNRTKSLH